MKKSVSCYIISETSLGLQCAIELIKEGYQFLGIITVLLILTVIYFTIKFKRPDFLNYYIFIVVLFYITNLVFLGLKSDKEMLTKKILKESFVNNELN